MFQIIKQQVRESTAVEFYSPAKSTTLAESDKKRFYEKYVLTGKQLNVANEVSEDGLTQTTTAMWISEEAANEFISDPEMAAFIQDWADHQAVHGVTGNLISKTTL